MRKSPMKMPNISLRKIALYALLLATIPCIWVVVDLQAQFDQCSTLEHRIQTDLERAQITSPVLKREAEIRTSLKDRDHSFVNQYLETFIPLSSEIDLLKERSQRGFLPDEEVLRRRLEFLNSGQNSITFVEGAIQTTRGIKETIETQTKPVEMNGEDISDFLYLIEGSAPVDTADSYLTKRPLLNVLECRIERKKPGSNQGQHLGSSEVYVISSKLLKKECVE